MAMYLVSWFNDKTNQHIDLRSLNYLKKKKSLFGNLLNIFKKIQNLKLIKSILNIYFNNISVEFLKIKFDSHLGTNHGLLLLRYG